MVKEYLMINVKRYLRHTAMDHLKVLITVSIILVSGTRCIDPKNKKETKIGSI